MAKSRLSDEERAERRAKNQREARERRERERQERIDAAQDRVRRQVEAAGVPLEGGSFGTDEGGETSRWNNQGMEQYADVPALVDTVSPPFAVESLDLSFSPVLTHEKIRMYLNEVSRHGAKLHAAYLIGVTADTMRALSDRYPAFSDMVAEAIDFHSESLSKEAVRRGRDGILKPVFSPALGTEIGVERVYDSRLLEVEMKRRMPNEYRENVSVDVNQSRPHILIIQAPIQSPADWQAERNRSLAKKEEERRLAKPEATDV